METIIRIENLSKQYNLGVIGTGSLAHDFYRWLFLIRGKDDPYLKISEANDRSIKGISNYVWALKDINLEVKRGEVLGIIGKNGAGKSTLLKILSKVTTPTTGYVMYQGRIGSLLEVGTGFHPELTGRENIFLNGAILGMRKKEIIRKFSDIVDFSGCERYIDTPVKRYSSGMMVRLGFAVAAFLEPEILIVDEVLAVGDSEFQKMAIGKMQDVSRNEGRTVLFVSHNMTAISQLCKTTLLIDKGTKKAYDKTDVIIRQYLDQSLTNSSEWDRKDDCNGQIIFKNVKLTNKNGLKANSFNYDEEIIFQIIIQSKIKFPQLGMGLRVTNAEGIAVFTSTSYDQSKELFKIDVGIWEFMTTIPSSFLSPGKYYVDLGLFKPGELVFDHIENELSFTIEDVNFLNSLIKDDRKGIVAPVFTWNIQQLYS
jgi:lipopolysaccharide transport system ATP-binding protein